MKYFTVFSSVLLLAQTLNAALTFTSTNETFVVTALQSLPWDQTLDLALGDDGEEVHFLPLHEVLGDYNPCDMTTFKPEAITSYLNSVGVTDKSKVIGFSESANIMKLCQFGPALMQWEYTTYITRTAQVLGLDKVIINVSPALTIYKILPPEVDGKQGTVYGEKITISSFMTNAPLPDGLKTGVNSTFTLSEASYDANPFSSLFEPFGPFRLFAFLIHTVLSLGLLYYSGNLIKALLDKYQEVVNPNSGRASTRVTDATSNGGSSGKASSGAGSSAASNTSSAVSSTSKSTKNLSAKQKKVLQAKKNQIRIRLLILVPEFLSAVCKVISGIDPYNYFNLVPFGFFFQREIVTISIFLAFASDIVTIIFFTDVYNTFAASRQMKSHTSFLDKNNFNFPMLVVFEVAFPVFLTLVYRMSLYKIITFPIVLVDALVSMLVSLIISIRLLYIGLLMRKEALKILESHSKMSSTGENDKVTTVINNILRHRKFMLVVSFGRFLVVIGVLLLGMGWPFRSPTNYLIGVGGLLWGALQVSSCAGVLSCGEDVITSSGSNKGENDSNVSGNFSVKSSMSSSSSSVRD